MAWHPTKGVMDLEPIETGDSKEGVSLLQMAAEVMGETEKIPMQESLIQEAWCGWEESWMTAHRMQRVGAALWDDSTQELLLLMQKLAQDEWENLDK